MSESAPLATVPTQPAPRAVDPKTSADYLPTLDGWRSVAIGLVLICHGFPDIPAAEKGAVGVNIFFGISGFLICSRLLAERRKTGRISLAGFYLRRTFRIFPPYFAYLAVVSLLAGAGLIVIARGDLASCLLFFRNYYAPADSSSWYTGHFWSLAVEEHFYLFFPALLIALGGRGARWKIAALAVAIAAWRGIEIRQQYLPRVLPGVSNFLRTDLQLDSLLWGCWMALVLETPSVRARMTAWLTPVAWWIGLAGFVALTFVHVPLDMAWMALLIPFLLAGTVLRPESRVGTFLESRPMRWVGRISYSLYLWQQLFLAKPEVRIPQLGPLQRLPLNLAAVFACALVSYHLIERPMIRLGHRLSSRLAPTLPVPAGEPGGDPVAAPTGQV